MTRTRWIPLLAAVVLVTAFVASAFWWINRSPEPVADASDCAVVEEVAREWATMEAASETGISPVGWSTMSEKARVGADAVAAPALAEHLNAWADGFELLAKIQLQESPAPFEAGNSSDEVERLREAGDLIYLTADELHEACPNAWVPQGDG